MGKNNEVSVFIVNGLAMYLTLFNSGGSYKFHLYLQKKYNEKNMRTLLTIITFLYCLVLYSQVNQINIVNGIPSNNNVSTNVSYVNGVPTSEDIGGVDIEYEQGVKFIRDFTDCYYYERRHEEYDNLFVKLTNYNNFPVTVYYEIAYKYLIPTDLNGRGEWTDWFFKTEVTQGKIVIPPATGGKIPIQIY